MTNFEIITVANIVTYIFMFFASLWFGNFITSFYFRIPRGISLNGKTNPPMCSNCGVKLKYPDYGPIYYYIFRAKKCKVCGVEIPKEYFFIEVFTAIICLLIFIIHGLNDKSCFMVFLILSLILAMLINMKHGKISEKSLWIVIVGALCYAMFNLKYEANILYILILSLAFGFIASGIFAKIVKQPSEGYIPMIAILGLVYSPIVSLCVFIPVFFIMGIFKNILQKHIMTLLLLISIVIVIANVSFPMVELL
jgi:prepilin signal peptidase PulO-like enzyme (type II secretory pathway)